MDKGKVLRKVFKKKLAEYVQAKEQKGDQDVHSETVPTTKAPIIPVIRREPVDIDLNFYTYRGSQKTPSAVPIKIQASLSNDEKRKLVNTVKSINQAVGLGSAQAIVERMNSLLKRLIPESNNYSLEYANALLNIIQKMNENVDVLVPQEQRADAGALVENAFNQIQELLEERIQQIRPAEEEGIAPAEVSIPSLEEGIPKTVIPPKREKIEFESVQPIETPEKSLTVPNIQLPQNPYNSAINTPKWENSVRKAERSFNDTYLKLKNQEGQDKLEEEYNKFLRSVARPANIGAVDTAFVDFEQEVRNLTKRKIKVKVPASSAQASSSGKGMRKGRHNTHRGYIGYGGDMSMMGCGHTPAKGTFGDHIVFSTTPAVDKGFATAPMNANSPFNQPAYRSRQTSAIPKYLNFNMIPNEKGNFAVIED